MFRSTVLFVGLFAVYLPACSKCSGERPTPSAPEALVWKEIRLGIDQRTFQRKAAKVGGIEARSAESLVTCQDQLALVVPNIDEEVIVERAAGSHRLSNCVASVTGPSTTQLLRIRGEFIDDKLARVTFRFRPAHAARLAVDLEALLGSGDEESFEERTGGSPTTIELTLWRADEEVWLLGVSRQGSPVLVHQDLAASAVLPRAKDQTEPKKPVSLEDIGIGSLDLHAPLPDIPVLDAGNLGD